MTGTDAALRSCDEAAAMLGPLARRMVPLGPLTTYRVGGPANVFVEADSLEDLASVARAVNGTGVQPLVVGRGSNLLVADAGFCGLVVVLGPSFATVEIEGTGVAAGAAVSLPVLARRCAAAGLRGLEWAVGVPGSVGGAVRMNAGGHGSEISRCLTAATVFDLGRPPAGEAVHLGPDQLAFGYRRSGVGPACVVVHGRFELALGSRTESEALVAEIVRWRRANQPGGANAGSVFTNPPGDSAGRLVEAAGLKGRRRGSAFVSPRHANFFQADPGGAAGDVADLIEEVRAEVAGQSGVELETEVQLVGFSNPRGQDDVEV